MNLNLEDFHDDCIDLLKEPARNKQTLFNDGRNKVKKSMYPQILITLVLRLASLCVEKKNELKPYYLSESSSVDAVNVLFPSFLLIT